jgi:hypothetical protein
MYTFARVNDSIEDVNDYGALLRISVLSAIALLYR